MAVGGLLSNDSPAVNHEGIVTKKDLDKKWFKLDNAAKIYPSAKNKRWNAVFRCSAVLKEKVDPEALQLALDDVVGRFPTMLVALRRGLFWYYFQHLTDKPKIEEEANYPASPFQIDVKKFMFRVVYSRNRVSVEFFHSLCDGYGGINFLNTLLLRYFELQGKKIKDFKNILHYADSPTEEEFEDSFKRYTDLAYGKVARKEPKAYKLRGELEFEGVLNVTHGECSLARLKEIAKSYNVTLNHYLNAVMAYVIYQRQIRDKNQNNRDTAIKIQCPVNLRMLMPSKTLRNFAGTANICIKPEKEDATFEEILEEVAKQLKEEVTKEKMLKFINANVEIENNVAIRMVPLFIKCLAMNFAFYSMGEKLVTIPISNMGIVPAPKEYIDFVDRYEFVMGAPKYNTFTCSVGSFADKTVITFSRKVKEGWLERDFFRFLASQGVEVMISANRGEE